MNPFLSKWAASFCPSRSNRVLHHGVVVPQVVRGVLEVRLDLAGVGVHGDTGIGEVVALADPSVEVGTRVPVP